MLTMILGEIVIARIRSNGTETEFYVEVPAGYASSKVTPEHSISRNTYTTQGYAVKGARHLVPLECRQYLRLLDTAGNEVTVVLPE